MRLACVQCDVAFGDPPANIHALISTIEMLAAQQVDLAIFPEAYLTGYCVRTHADADRIAIGREALQPIQEAVDRLGLLVIAGFAEKAGHTLHNAAALFEPGLPTRYYRKTHLPELGLDKHVEPGEELDVFETRLGKIGILICFDQRLPEPARVLTLRGAELIALPTNWPQGAEVSAEHMSIARAAENRVFMATCNRIGEENGFRFIGKSKIIAPNGRVLASAGSEAEVLVADIDLAEAQFKRNVIIPGEFETDMIGTRRPDLYREIAPEPVDAAAPAPPLWV